MWFYYSILMMEIQYKSLLINEKTTMEDVVRILFHCYGMESVVITKFSLYEHCKTQNYKRKLNNEDQPLSVQDSWLDPEQFCLVHLRAPGEGRRGSIYQLGLPCVPVHGHAMTDTRALHASY